MAAGGLQQQLLGTLVGVLPSQLVLVRDCMQSQQAWQDWQLPEGAACPAA
jgi:hypothetical protein